MQMQTHSETWKQTDPKLNLTLLTLFQVATVSFFIFLFLKMSIDVVSATYLTITTAIIILFFRMERAKNHSVSIRRQGEKKPFLLMHSGIIFIPFFKSYKVSHVCELHATYQIETLQTYSPKGDKQQITLNVFAEYIVTSSQKFLIRNGNQQILSDLIGKMKLEIRKQIYQGNNKNFDGDMVTDDTIEYIENKYGVMFNYHSIIEATDDRG